MMPRKSLRRARQLRKVRTRRYVRFTRVQAMLVHAQAQIAAEQKQLDYEREARIAAELRLDRERSLRRRPWWKMFLQKS